MPLQLLSVFGHFYRLAKAECVLGDELKCGMSKKPTPVIVSKRTGVPKREPGENPALGLLPLSLYLHRRLLSRAGSGDRADLQFLQPQRSDMQSGQNASSVARFKSHPRKSE
jgi:hypothetical protein